MTITNNAADLDAEVRSLKDRRALASRNRIRAEHERDAAQAQADKLRAQLLNDFGVSTVDEARAKLDELQGKLSAEVAALRHALDDIGV